MGEPVFEPPLTPVKQIPAAIKVATTSFFKRQGKSGKGKKGKGAQKGSRQLTPMVLIPVEKDEQDEPSDSEEERQAAEARVQELSEIRGELGLFDAKLSTVMKDLLLLKEEVDRIRERQATRDLEAQQGTVGNEIKEAAGSEPKGEEVMPVEIVGENLFRPQQRDSEVIPLNKPIHPLIPFTF